MTVLVMALAVLMKAVGCCGYAGIFGVDRIYCYARAFINDFNNDFGFFFSDSLGFIMGTEYHIDNTKTTWEKANELCKRNGTILAEPSHSTITELAERLRSLGYTNSDRFWIGLTFNPATSQFVWSTGDIAQQNLVNLTCGKFAGSLRRICYVLTNIDHSSSPCFLRWSCQDARYGYICQNGPEGKVLSNSCQ